VPTEDGGLWGNTGQGYGFDPIGDTPAQFSAYLKTEFQRWATLIRSRGIKAE
jgi:hypothetical protein